MNASISINRDQLIHDKKQAEHFLTLLDEEADVFCFQTLDDNKQRKDPGLVREMHGTLDDCWQDLCRLNEAGAGVYVTVNETDGTGRKKYNMTRVRALWQEQDRPGCPELPVTPHITVESSPGKHHKYVLIDGCPSDAFDGLQERLVADYGSDPGAKDISRVLRLPGFYHLKDPANPHMVRIVSQSNEQPLSYEKAVSIFPPVVRKPKALPEPGKPVASLDEIQSALSALNPDVEYMQWLNIGMALHNHTGGSAEGLEKWDCWSKGGKLYRPGECAYKWDSFGTVVEGLERDKSDIFAGSGITIKTLFKMANDTGWRWENEVQWQQPVDLDHGELPTLTSDILPKVLGDMVAGVAAATETPLELGTLYGLGTLSAVCQGRYIVEPEPGYTEPTNIYTNTFLDPGNRKSSVQRFYASPLIDLERRLNEEMEPIIAEAAIKRRNQEARISSLRSQYSKAKTDDVAEIEKQLIDLEKNPVVVPTKPQIWTQDVTPERAGALMAENGGRLAILSAEGGIFENIGGRYSAGIPNLDLFLQAHSGDPVRVDRGQRTAYMERPALTISLSMQPGILSTLARHTAFRSLGLWARFLMAIPPSPLGKRTLQTVPLDDGVRTRFNACISALFHTETADDPFGKPQPYILRFSPEAYIPWKEFALGVERELADGGDFEHIRDWAGKLPGQAARIAAIFHCAEHALSQPWTKLISSATMEKTLELATLLSRHAIVIFEQMGASTELTAARKIWKWISRNREARFSRRDCHQALRGSFPKIADLKPGMDLLVERGYIRQLVADSKGPGRKPDEYEVNPIAMEGWR